MKSTTTRKGFSAAPEVPRQYTALIRRFPLRPIRGAAEYARAAEVLDALVLRDDLSDWQADYMQVLSGLIEEYDAAHPAFGTDQRTPLQRLKALMEAAGITPSRLGDIIGSRPAASMILGGTRGLSKAHIARLAQHLNIEPGYFIQPARRVSREKLTHKK